MRPRIDEAEREEVHAGLLLRVEQLKNAKKKCEESGLHAGVRDAEDKLTILRGKDGDPGLLSKFVDQTTLDFNAGKSEGGAPSESDDLFDGADRSTKRRGRATAKATSAEGETAAGSTGEPEGDYEIVDETAPPPKADEVESLVPR